MAGAAPWRVWQCINCGWIYDEEAGDPAEGLSPGTRWTDVPADWFCPQCGTPKDEFEMVEL